MEESDFAGVGGAKPFVEEASALVDGTICSKTGTGEPLLLLHGIFVESRSMGVAVLRVRSNRGVGRRRLSRDNARREHHQECEANSG